MSGDSGMPAVYARREPLAGTSLVAVTVLAVLMLPLVALFGIPVIGGLGDCVDPPCGPPPDVRTIYGILVVLTVAMPFIAARALFGDHLYSRLALVALAVVFFLGSLGGAPITALAALPAVVVGAVAAFASWKWLVNRRRIDMPHDQPGA